MAEARSNQGRKNKKKTGQTAGKGFVAPRASRADKKAIGKGLVKMAAVAAPGGVAGKAAVKVGRKVVEKAIIKKFGNEGRIGLMDASMQGKGNVAALKSILKNKKKNKDFDKHVNQALQIFNKKKGR